MKRYVLLIVMCLTVNFTSSIAAQEKTRLTSHIKTSLNAYSFNSLLAVEKTMDINDLFEYCVSRKIDAVDLTAYYFPTYPKVPSDEFLYEVKRNAFLLGVAISGTGVKNDFTNPNIIKRKESIQLVKDWIIAAEKMGAPVIRIFAGVSDVSNYSRTEVTGWLVTTIKECVAFGKAHGVVVAIQNHHDFIANADQVIDLIKKVDSDWFGLILDTGSYWEGDSYAQIEKTVQYAVNWQVKEMIYMNGKEEKADIERIFKIIRDSGYSGYVPIETLEKGDPTEVVDAFIIKIKETIKKVYNN
ncbi:sugar phosphate isomerase/epimerase family protein [Aurantibacter sp.]|uniref:sugar phosphate isomerase/epimerase family protein n=1 Tax=Aurantibacter sp. TaxID=2807103 RepID=UPI003265FF75